MHKSVYVLYIHRKHLQYAKNHELLEIFNEVKISSVQQTSGAGVPGSNPASPIMILMRCRIIVKYCRNLRQKRETYLLRPKKDN